jgi:peptidoglycan hydrolase CwlO-like protein
MKQQSNKYRLALILSVIILTGSALINADFEGIPSKIRMSKNIQPSPKREYLHPRGGQGSTDQDIKKVEKDLQKNIIKLNRHKNELNELKKNGKEHSLKADNHRYEINKLNDLIKNLEVRIKYFNAKKNKKV